MIILLCLKMSWCVHAKSFQLCPTLCDPMNYSLPGSSVHGILQARILEWVSMPSSRGSSWPRDQTCVSYIEGRFFPIEPPERHSKIWLRSKRKGKPVICSNRDEPWELYAMWNKPDTKRLTPGDGEGQGSLACCSPWGCRVGRDLVTEQQRDRSYMILLVWSI